MTASDPVLDDGAPAGSHYHGLEIRRLANRHMWVDVLATAGPRIVRLGLPGSSRNLLAETPDQGWETPHGRYELFGGHRLWFAPEDPDLVAIPDGHGLVLEAEEGRITLTGPAESQTGLVRSMTVCLAPERAELEIRHQLHNVGDRTIELAPWAITQLPLGGTVIMPQQAAITGHHVHPNRTLVLWPYTSWEDPRFRPRDGLLAVDAESGPSLKVGYLNEAGWIGYLHDGTLLVRHFQPLAGRRYPDLGCNAETYVGRRFLELELLGPLAELGPGSTVTFMEWWQIRREDPVLDAPGLRRLAERITGDGTDRGAGGMRQPGLVQA